MDEEMEHAKTFFHKAGWDDYLNSESKEFSLRALIAEEALWGQPQALIEQWYADGWNEAKATEQKMGCPVFTLVELRKRMKEAIEWYGEDFDAPLAMISKVLRELGYSEPQRNPSLPAEPRPLVVDLSRRLTNPDHLRISARAVTYAYATSQMHMFAAKEGIRQHTYTAIGHIAFQGQNIVLQRDFEGTDSESLEQAMKQWCQSFHDLLGNTELRVIPVNKEV